MAELGTAGAAAKKERGQVVDREPIPLETAADIRRVLEGEIARVAASKADPIAKANAIARLATAALALLRTCELEAQVEELRALIIERFPDSVGRLKRVK